MVPNYAKRLSKQIIIFSIGDFQNGSYKSTISEEFLEILKIMSILP